MMMMMNVGGCDDDNEVEEKVNSIIIDNEKVDSNNLIVSIPIENVLVDVERILDELSKENHKDGIRLLEQCAKDLSCALLHASQTLQQKQQQDENGIVLFLMDVSNSIQEYYIRSSPPNSNSSSSSSSDEMYNLEEIAKAGITIAKLLLGGIQTIMTRHNDNNSKKKEDGNVILYTSTFVWNVIKLQMLFLQCLWVQTIYVLRAQLARRDDNLFHCMTEFVGFTITTTVIV